jgi:hypothetical protein
MALKTFPALAGVAYPVIRTAIWLTDSYASIAGKRTTLGRYISPRYRYTLTYGFGDLGFLRSTAGILELQDLLTFYNTVGGMRDLWLFNDPDDNTATAQAFGTGDGVTTLFQLARTMVGLTFSFSEPVYFATVTTIFDNGVAVNPANYTVSTTGGVLFTVAPVAAHALTWTGTYKWGCRFEMDENDFAKMMLNLWESKKIVFSTEKI